jgi:replicative DNA helicase
VKLPAAPEAEQAAVGAMLLSRGAVEVGLDRCAPEDFVSPRLALIFGAMVDLYHAGSPIDPVTVHGRLAEIGHAEQVGGLAAVLRLQALTPASSSISAYTETVARYASARRAMFVGEALIEAGGKLDLDGVEALVDEAPARIAMPGPEVEAAEHVQSFLGGPEVEPEWLVRESLEVGDRLIVTGREGGGKSVWLRQLGWQMASGEHPFFGTRERRLRVLHVDCENSRAQVARGYRLLASKRPTDTEAPLWVLCRPQGLDLTARRDAAWLDGLVARHEAQVLVIGPLYKLHRPTDGQGSGEDVAAATALALDRLRAAYGCAILIEAHAPHAERKDFRPFGSSLWLRWPEFGFGLVPGTPGPDQRPVVSIEHWRGMRDDTRAWPTSLTRRDDPGTWPWAPGGVRPPQGIMGVVR